MAEQRAPTLLIIFGPPAVGKMAVGHEIARRTGLRLFHNHLTIEPVLRFFEFGTPPFLRLVEEFRTRIFEEVGASDLPGMIFTFVWAFDQHGESDALERYASPFQARGGRVLFVELEASLEERLRRTEGAFRLAEKPSMRDLEKSRGLLRELESKHRLNSTGEFDGRADYLRIDNTERSPQVVAEQIITRFDLRRKEHDEST
jgi:hypothetical protein